MRKIFLHSFLCAAMVGELIPMPFGWNQAQAQKIEQFDSLQMMQLGLSDEIAEFDTPLLPENHEQIDALENSISHEAHDKLRRSFSKFTAAAVLGLSGYAIGFGAPGDAATLSHIVAGAITLLALPFTYSGLANLSLWPSASKRYRNLYDKHEAEQLHPSPESLKNLLAELQSTLLKDYNLINKHAADILHDDEFWKDLVRIRQSAERVYWKNYTLAHLAALTNNSDVLRALFHLHAKYSPKAYAHRSINATTDYGHTPIDLAIMRGSTQAFKSIVIQQQRLIRQQSKLSTSSVSSQYHQHTTEQLGERTKDLTAVLNAFENRYAQQLQLSGDEARSFWSNEFVPNLVTQANSNADDITKHKLAVYDVVTWLNFNTATEPALFTLNNDQNTLLTIALDVGNLKAAAALIEAGSPVLEQNIDYLEWYVKRLEEMWRYMSDYRYMTKEQSFALRESIVSAELRITKLANQLLPACNNLLKGK